MKRTPSETVLALMAQAAELKAAGATWEAVAAKVRRSAAACRNWRYRYPEEWRRLLRQSLSVGAHEGAGESFTYTRKLLRSENEWICLGAARLFLNHVFQVLALEARAEAAVAAKEAKGPAWKSDPFIEQVNGVPHEVYQSWLRLLLAEGPRPSAGPQRGEDRPAGPAVPQ